MNNELKSSVSSCLECHRRFSKGKQVELFDDFGPQPQCIKNLTSYSEYSKLAIASISCNTFRPSGYSYLHLAGHVTWKENQKILDGTIGVLKPEQLADLETTNAVFENSNDMAEEI